ncbi:Ap-3 complex subunit sigma [Plakobranchus ocellatus]|uniref:Ap-3 complex subunit sigma n=1 Tax=Plakobranchus ocellatus TaxID=259542 RepID=A0AAV4D957_9GAST|nr:Ap-3 complex subunit sigma [Plakobranchus ocellatus]
MGKQSWTKEKILKHWSKYIGELHEDDMSLVKENAMIKAILVFNNHGKPRLSKFYQYYPEDVQHQIIRETFHLVSKRDDNVFVETLDKCFENVCELDLIFHVDKVHYILSELVMGGMVLETNMTEIITRIEEQNKLEKQEAGISAAPARAVSAMKEMNIPQKIKDIKLPDLPSIGNLKF